MASGFYREDVNLTLSCEPGELAWQLMLSFTGNAVGFDADSATVATPQQADLAVKLLALCNRRGTARKVAQSIGVCVPAMYKWKKDLISDEAYQSMRKRKATTQDKNQETMLGEIQRLRQQVHQLQLERDILTKANELIKKTWASAF